MALDMEHVRESVRDSLFDDAPAALSSTQVRAAAAPR